MIWTYRQLVDGLGVGYELRAYETCPWSSYDSDRGVTCSAEVRSNADVDELEAEIQLSFDNPPPGKENGEVVFWARFVSRVNSKWEIVQLRVRGEDYVKKVADWESKALNFYLAATQFIKADEIPDFNELIEREFHTDRKGSYSGSGSSKSPIIRPNQLLDIKRGGSF